MRLTAFTLMWIVVAIPAAFAQTPQIDANLSEAELTKLVADLDEKMFRAYNECSLEAFAEMLAPDIDAYHDRGGRAVGRDTLKGLVQTNICTGRHVRRELLAGSLDVSPIRGFGAVQTSASVFWERQPDGSEAKVETAKDVKLWQQRDGVWVLAIWISYDHRRLNERADDQR